MILSNVVWKKRIAKAISAVLMALLIAGFFRMPVMAEEEWGYGNPERTVKWVLTEEDGKNILTFSVLDSATTDKQKAIIQVLDQNGNSVSSTFKNSINEVRIEEGITGIGWTTIENRNTYQPQWPSDYPVDGSGKGTRAFQDFRNLETVKTCSTIKRIGWSAFRRCTSLKNLDFSTMTNLEEIMNQAFSPCGLSEVDLSACTKLKTIGHGAFNGQGSTDHKLESVKLPENLETIGSNAFYQCRNLKYVSFMDISSVKNVYNNAFQGINRSITQIEYIADEKTKQKAVLRKAAIDLFSGVTDFPEHALDYTGLGKDDYWPLTVDVKDKTTVYNSAEQEGYTISGVSGSGDDSCAVTGLKDGHELSVPDYTPSKGTDAGTYDNGSFPDDPEFKVMYEGYDYAINYTMAEKNPGKLTIEKLKELKVKVTGHSGSMDYNGKTQTVSGYDFEVADPENIKYTSDDFTFSGTDVAERKDSGTTNMGLAAGQFTNKNDNIETVTFDVTDGSITINKIAATVTTGSGKKAYDGKPLKNSEASITGLAEGDKFTVKATGSRTKVGSCPNTYEIIWGTVNPDNYEISEELGILEVTEAETVDPDDENTEGKTGVKTGDTGRIYLWLSVFLASLSACVALATTRMRSK